jgi:hypothetical protein
VPAALRRRLERLQRWSHTPRALWLGTLSAGTLAVFTVVMLATVGFGGVGTHVELPPAPLADTYSSGIPSSIDNVYPPVYPLPPLIAGPPLPPDSSLPNRLATLVLQPYDLPIDFRITDQGANDNTSEDGLVGSYHVLFTRGLNGSSSAGLPGVISVLSIASVYRDVPVAAAPIEGNDLSGLGTLAGLPDLKAEPVSVTQVIGDETRVVHLTGNSYGFQIGAYLVEFRRGAVDGIVGLVAPKGSESLHDAIALAQQQESRIEQSEPFVP